MAAAITGEAAAGSTAGTSPSPLAADASTSMAPVASPNGSGDGIDGGVSAPAPIDEAPPPAPPPGVDGDGVAPAVARRLLLAGRAGVDGDRGGPVRPRLTLLIACHREPRGGGREHTLGEGASTGRRWATEVGEAW